MLFPPEFKFKGTSRYSWTSLSTHLTVTNRALPSASHWIRLWWTVDQGLMCTSLTYWHSECSCSTGGANRIRNVDQDPRFHQEMLILELPSLPTMPVDLPRLCHGLSRHRERGSYWRQLMWEDGEGYGCRELNTRELATASVVQG